MASNRTTDSSRDDTGFQEDMTDSLSGKRRDRNGSSRTATSRSNDGGSANSGAGGKNHGTINRDYLCGFVDTFRCKEFKAKYNYKSFNMNEFLDWVCAVGGGADAPEPVREIYANSMKKLDSMRTRNEKKRHKNPEVQELALTIRQVLDTQQVKQIARASVAFHSYAAQDERVYELFENCFKNTDISPRFIIGTAYLPCILGHRKSKQHDDVMSTMQQPSKLEALLYFHCIRIYTGTFKTLQSPNIGNRMGYALQKILDCWVRLMTNVKSDDLGRFSSLILPFIMFDENIGMFRVLKSREDGFSTSVMETRLTGVRVVHDGTGVSVAAWNRGEDLDTAIRYIVDMFCTHVQTVLSRGYLYTASEKDLSIWIVLCNVQATNEHDWAAVCLQYAPSQHLRDVWYSRPRDPIGFRRRCEW